MANPYVRDVPALVGAVGARRIARLARSPTAWIALVAAAATVFVAVLRARGPTVRTSDVDRSDLEQHVVVSGRVRVPTRVAVAAQTSGLVVDVGATEGKHVAAGDLLVRMDDTEAQAAKAQAKASVDQARARVEQLRRVGAIVADQALRQAETDVEQAEADFARATALAESGAVPRADFDSARRTLDRARAQRASAEVQQIAATPLGADSRVALTALLEAQARLAGAEARLALTRIVAMQEGVVLTRSVEPGDVVTPGRTLMIFAADAGGELVFDADERNIPFLELGQHASASADAYPDDDFAAHVTYIAPSIDPQRGSIEVRLAVVPPPPLFLKPDMTVSVDLTVRKRARVLAVSSEVVHGASTPTPWVLVFEDGRAWRRDVKLGIRGDGATEIVAGLADGAHVIVPDGQRIESGDRVREAR